MGIRLPHAGLTGGGQAGECPGGLEERRGRGEGEVASACDHPSCATIKSVLSQVFPRSDSGTLSCLA